MRDLHIAIYMAKPYGKKKKTWWWPYKAETCSFNSNLRIYIFYIRYELCFWLPSHLSTEAKYVLLWRHYMQPGNLVLLHCTYMLSPYSDCTKYQTTRRHAYEDRNFNVHHSKNIILQILKLFLILLEMFWGIRHKFNLRVCRWLEKIVWLQETSQKYQQFR